MSVCSRPLWGQQNGSKGLVVVGQGFKKGDFVCNLYICLYKKLEYRNKCRLGQRNFPTRPLEIISIDFIVDLSLKERNNKHILTIDHFIKYTAILYFTTTFHNIALKIETGWATRMVKPIFKARIVNDNAC